MKSISFLSDGQRIDGTLLLPHGVGKIPGVLFFHGMTSSQKRYISYGEELAKHGIGAFTLSLRGHGTSEGDFNRLIIKDMIKDGLSAYDFLLTNPRIDSSRIGICGASVGAAVAALVSTERVVKSLVLRVPATYTDEMMQMTFAQIMAEEEDKFKHIHSVSNTQAIKAISNFPGSLLIVTSENDHLIPPIIPKIFYSEAKKALRKEIVEIKVATHELKQEVWRKQFKELLTNWFKSTL